MFGTAKNEAILVVGSKWEVLIRMFSHKCRSGMSLLELFAVLTILSILTSLVVSGVQSARESARRTQCQSSMRQISLGFSSGESAHRCFPSFYLGYSKNIPRSPFVEVLPYVEDHLPIRNTIEVAEEFLPTFSPDNRHVAFLCPSDGYDSGTSYRLSYGSSIFADARPISFEIPGNGAFSGLKRMRARDFTDGLSNTVGLSERNIGNNGQFLEFVLPLLADTSTAKVAGNPNLNSNLKYEFGGQSLLYGSVRHIGFSVSARPNDSQADFLFCDQLSLTSMCYAGLVAARSNHFAGVNASFMDGANRFVSNSIDKEVWKSLGTRAGAEIVDLAEFDNY